MVNKIIINGFGRIGKNILRLLFEHNENLEVIAINEPYSEIEDLRYAIKYDSLLGEFNGNISIRNNKIILENEIKKWEIELTKSERLIVNRNDAIIIDSSSLKNIDRLCKDNSKAKAVFLTKWYDNANRIHLYDDRYINTGIKNNVISCGICDTVGIIPVLDCFSPEEINNISIVTMHPFLGYQNLVDGFSRENNHVNFPNIQMGRSSINSIIPKKSSVSTILEKIYPSLCGKLVFMTYRIPTEVVTACDITLSFKNPVNSDKTKESLQSLSKKVCTITDPLVSRDFYKSRNNCIMDLNWSYIANNTMHLTLWYNNELGYSNSVCQAIFDFITD